MQAWLIPLALLLLLLLASGTRACKSSCKSEDLVDASESFLTARHAVFECLFREADKDRDGRVTEAEFYRFTKAKLSLVERMPLYWSMVTSWCNCDCDKSSITWEDVNGTIESCLYSELLVEQAHKRLCK